ncbi:MAG: response regulator [Deltaproteobacteria bacterium]|nr:response regulator [Deltaproteobacteria bacterium]
MTAPASVNGAVLVADDEPGITDLLEWELESKGYEVVTAASGLLAVEQLHRAEFDVVITDVRMPGLTGLDVLKVAKERAPETEVIVMTAVADVESAIECVRGGAFDLVQKPFEATSLLAIVARALERRELRAATALYRASRAILASDAQQRLPEVVVDVTMRVMGADHVSLMLQGGDGKLYIAHSHGLSAEVQAATQLELGERIAGRIAASREPALISNGASEDARFGGVVRLGQVQSSIVCPLAVEERLVGVLNVGRVATARRFSRHDLDRAVALASQVLLALENRRLVEQIAASERLASVGELAAGVAHEINNPVTYVLTSHVLLRERLEALFELAALLEGDTSRGGAADAWRRMGGRAALDEFRDVLGDAEEGAGRIREIATDLRSLARAETGPPALVDLNDAIRSALRIAGAELRRTATLSTELGAGVEVTGHVGRLSQVFINLLVNAAQAMGERRGEVAVTSGRDGEWIFARVRDTGLGITPEALRRIFEPFFTTKAPGRGTGLGLTLSRKIVREHGGELTVESAPGGTTFVVTLPAAKRA